jgi:hypothetical protein
MDSKSVSSSYFDEVDKNDKKLSIEIAQRALQKISLQPMLKLQEAAQLRKKCSNYSGGDL